MGFIYNSSEFLSSLWREKCTDRNYPKFLAMVFDTFLNISNHTALILTLFYTITIFIVIECVDICTLCNKHVMNLVFP